MVNIGTHSGSFHCDEALGCYLLKQTEQFRDGIVVRSRDPGVWKDMDVLIDVGGTYDPATHRYDHHQREFKDVFGHGFSTKLSSAGLVYKHFGMEIVAKLTGKLQDDPDVHTVWLRVYKTFMEAVDAIDNGIDQYPAAKGTDAAYLQTTTLSSRVGFLNPEWNVPHTNADLDTRFQGAMALTGLEFTTAVVSAASSWLPARAVVARCLSAAPQVHASGEIIKFDQHCPWKSHLYDLEQEAGTAGKIKFVVYEDERENKWRVQAVNVSASSFDLRKALPAAWRGLRDAALSEISGIPGCVFVHAAGFWGQRHV